MTVCMGSLKTVNDTSLIEGYSKSHLKSFFGHTEFVYIKGTANSFDESCIDHTDGNSIAGVQRKVFMRLEDGVLIPSNCGEYIVKPTPKAFDSLSENEHAIMKLCEAVGIKTAQCSVMPFEDGELAFISKRFDLIKNSKNKLFIEDGASVCQVSPQNKNNVSLSYEKTIKQMVDSCAGAQAAALTALRMLIFSYVVGNNNMHLKNFSLYRKNTNKTVIFDGFTPVYDMLSVAPYSHFFDKELSIRLFEVEALNGDPSRVYGDYTFKDFYRLAQSLAISANAAEKLILNFIAAIEKKASPILHNSNSPEHLKDFLLSRIMDKCRDMRR